MNEGGKLLVTGKLALQGASWDGFLFNPLGKTPPLPGLAPPTRRRGRALPHDDPPGQNYQCVGASNDFPAVLARGLPADLGRSGLDAEGRSRRWVRGDFTLNGEGLGGQPGQPVLAVDDVKHPARQQEYPQLTRSERPVGQGRRPAGLRSADRGAITCTSQTRPTRPTSVWTRTIDLTGKTSASLPVQALGGHRGGLRLRVRRGPHGRPAGLDDAAARRERQHEPGTRAPGVRTPIRSGWRRTRSCSH